MPRTERSPGQAKARPAAGLPPTPMGSWLPPWMAAASRRAMRPPGALLWAKWNPGASCDPAIAGSDIYVSSGRTLYAHDLCLSPRVDRPRARRRERKRRHRFGPGHRSQVVVSGHDPDRWRTRHGWRPGLRGRRTPPRFRCWRSRQEGCSAASPSESPRPGMRLARGRLFAVGTSTSGERSILALGR
jgi:hypothetical protein